MIEPDEILKEKPCLDDTAGFPSKVIQIVEIGLKPLVQR